MTLVSPLTPDQSPKKDRDGKNHTSNNKHDHRTTDGYLPTKHIRREGTQLQVFITNVRDDMTVVNGRQTSR